MEKFLNVELPSPVIIKIFGGEKTITNIKVFKIENDIYGKRISVVCSEDPLELLLWQDADYDSIRGEYNEDSIKSRIIEILNNE